MESIDRVEFWVLVGFVSDFNSNCGWNSFLLLLLEPEMKRSGVGGRVLSAGLVAIP